MIRAAFALALLAGCPARVPPEELPPPTLDPAQLLDRAAAEPAPGPSAAAFGLSLVLPDNRVSAQGALVVSPPDRFRIEVRGPIGPPQVVIVSDGKTLTTWLAGKNLVLREDDADGALAAYTGGKAGLESLASLLLGRLPPLGAPELVRRAATPGYRWSGPGESHVDVELDPRTAHLVALTLADEAGAALLSATVTGGKWPDTLEAVLPQQGIRATLDFDAWKPAAPTDATFVLVPPADAEVRPLLRREPPPIAPPTMQGP
jgi:outer membrane lipoprotein-sorting protein